MWRFSRCIINGDEYEKIVREVQSLRPLFLRLTLGAPLLSSHNDYVQLMQALRQQMPPIAADETVVFMSHGASHHAFAAYACLDHMMTAKGFPARVGAVELSGSRYSYRQPAPAGVKGVHLMPLMLVAGDHAINDMASDEEDSWKTLFNAAGITATPWLNGLGENPAVRAMFVAHLQQALSLAMRRRHERQTVCPEYRPWRRRPDHRARGAVLSWTFSTRPPDVKAATASRLHRAEYMRTDRSTLPPFPDERRQRKKRRYGMRVAAALVQEVRASRSGLLHPGGRHAVQHLGVLHQRIGSPRWLEIVRRHLFRRIAARSKNAAGHGAESLAVIS